jgi:hypothetical protein
LEKIKKEIKKVEELKKDLKQAQKETKKAEQERNNVQEELKGEKQLARITEEQLVKYIGKSDTNEIKVKVRKTLERELKKVEKEKLAANIEVNIALCKINVSI